MKQEFVTTLQEFKSKLSKLKRQLKAFDRTQVSKLEHRNAAEEIATDWVEKIRSPLEHKFKIDKETIETTAELMKRLHQLARPNNQKASYLQCLDAILTKFDDKFILPIQQAAPDHNSSIPSLLQLIPSLKDVGDSEYLREAIECAQAGYNRAAIVMGWCAAINRVRRKLIAAGFDALNNTSKAIKAQTSGKSSGGIKSSMSHLKQSYRLFLTLI